VRAAVQRAAGSLRLCGEMLADMRTAVSGRVKAEGDRLEAARIAKSPLLSVTQFTATLTQLRLNVENRKLMDAVWLIATERDSEAVKALGKEAIMTVAKIGMIVSGLELLKLAEEFIASAMDVYQTGQSMKLRTNQVKLASDLLVWLESVSMICLTWAVQAQAVVLRAEGSSTSDDEIVKMVTDRIVKLATRKTS
jgi:hypothetical protein